MTKAFIPVRGGSKSIPLKNIKPIAGMPLVFWTVDAAFRCPEIDEVLVSTDDPRIREVVGALIELHWSSKVRVVTRAPETAVDTASTESALLDWFESDPCDHVVLIQATSPLLTAEDLGGGLRKYFASGHDSLLSVVRQKRFIWAEQDGVGRPENYNPLKRPRRQEWEGFLVENGAFYVTKHASLLQAGNRLSGNVGLWEMDEASYFEIDEPSDWQIVEQLLRRRKEPPLEPVVPLVRLFVTDCDGVLTDGGMYYGPSGEVMKKFHTRDGVGLDLLRARGIVTAMITGEDSPSTLARAKKLRIEHVLSGVHDKLEALRTLTKSLGIPMSQTAYVGDDLNDREVLAAVGYPFAVADASSALSDLAVIRLRTSGGQGAVREAAERLLTGTPVAGA